jgi:propanol-preferring alcohol dehydrogenase
MKAQELQTITDLQHNPEPLVFCEREIPSPGPREVLLRVRACGVCHTELDEIEGRTPPP